MNIKYNLLALLLLCLSVAVKAQDDVPVMKKAPANVMVDGKLNEWGGDSLATYDPKTQLNYTIACDDSNLYVAAFISDKKLRRKIMAGGITISVNGEGKHRKTYSMTYPIPGKATFAGLKTINDDAELEKPSLIESTSIRVSGFKDVESDVITTSNTYGFKAAYSFDDNHNMIYETAIPLKMLYLKKGKKGTALAINVQVNGIERPDGESSTTGTRAGSPGGMGGGIGGMGGGGGMGGRGGMGGGRGGNKSANSQQASGGDPSGMTRESDFWVDMTLPQHS